MGKRKDAYFAEHGSVDIAELSDISDNWCPVKGGKKLLDPQREKTKWQSTAQKLTEQAVVCIRRDVDMTHGQCSRKYKVSEATIWAARAGRTWIHVGGLRPISEYACGHQRVSILKLSERDVLRIRSDTSMTHVECATRYGVSQSTIYGIRDGSRRKSVGGLRPMSDYLCKARGKVPEVKIEAIMDGARRGLSFGELASELGCGVSTIYQALRRNQLPTYAKLKRQILRMNYEGTCHRRS